MASPSPFHPSGVAYREHAESHTLWRWLGAQAPDLVLIVGEDFGLAAALGAQTVADMGRIPARQISVAALSTSNWVSQLGPIREIRSTHRA